MLTFVLQLAQTGGGFPPQQYLHLLVIVIALSISGISWVVRKLREQAQLRDEKLRRERRIAEMLRTGRPAPDAPASPAPQPAPPRQPPQASDEQARRREMLERRQQQLRELRRVAEGGSSSPLPPRTASQPAQTSSVPVPPPKPITAELWPGGPVIVLGPGNAPPRPDPAPARAPERPAQRPVPAPAGQRELQRQERLRAQAQQLRDNAAQKIADNAADTAARGDAVRLSPARAAVPIAAVPRTPAQWRAAIIASEILGQPLSMRE